MGGGDKFLREIDGVRLIELTLERLAAQVDRTLVSVNGNIDSIADLGLTSVEDPPGVAGRGPLSGILAGLAWTASNIGEDGLMLSIPADLPFAPLDLAARLNEARTAGRAEIAVASSVGRLHYAVGLWPAKLAGALERWLEGSNDSAVRSFLKSRNVVVAEFEGRSDPFFNINTPADLVHARSMAGERTR